MTYIYILLSVLVILSVIIIALLFKNKGNGAISSADKKDIVDSFDRSVNFISTSLASSQKAGLENVSNTVKTFQDGLTTSQLALEKRVLELIKQLDERMQSMSKVQEDRLESIRLSTERNIKSMQEDNNKQLDKMRETVDEKLSKTINERFDQSFKVLGDQLEKVYKSIGEMQTMATDVGSLTKMLSNVKTTGIFGEIQLGAILEQLLTRDQYLQNVVTGTNKEPVEFAIKLPGQSGTEPVLLPIDSKFPYTVYTDLQNAYDLNDKSAIKIKKDLLKNTIKNMAKDIKNKYINPPVTTDFAVMFLPIEGLYAEVLKMGLMEELQNTYNVTIAGPTTMSALLNSLQMGFRTLAIQKKSGEVWKVLGAVKTEFEKFNDLMEKIQSKLDSTSKDFDTLIGTRSRMIASKLKNVDKIEDAEASSVLLGTKKTALGEDNDNNDK